MASDCPVCHDSFQTERAMKSHRTQTHGSPWQDADTLRDLYWDEGLSLSEVGEELGCGFRTVCDWMEHHDIPRRDYDEANLTGDDHGMSKGGKVNVECAWCGSELRRYPYRLEVFDQQFCDAQCHADWVAEHQSGPDTLHPGYKGGRTEYGPGFNEAKKRKARERDGYACRACGREQADNVEAFGQRLHVHHAVPADRFDDPEKRNALDNLVSLCSRCHPRWERLAPLAPDTP